MKLRPDWTFASAVLAVVMACSDSVEPGALEDRADAESHPDATASSSSGGLVADAGRDATGAVPDSASVDAAAGWPNADSTGPRVATVDSSEDMTFSNAGTEANPIVHEGFRFEGVVTLNAAAAWHVFRDCRIENTSYWGIRIEEGASHIVIDHCEITGAQTAIAVGGTNISVLGNDLHDVENGVTTYGEHVEIVDNWIHNEGVGMAWGAPPHWDAIEVYGGSDVRIVHNELALDGHDDTSLVNVAPWGEGSAASDIVVTNNRMGGGGYHVTLDDEQPNGPHPLTGIVFDGNHHRGLAGFGLANIRDGVQYTWSAVWDCDGSPAAVNAWPSPCN